MDIKDETEKFEAWWLRYEDEGMSRADAMAAWKERARVSLQTTPSLFSPGDRAYFQPVISKIDGRTQESDDSSIPVLVEAVKFTSGKVLYDVALPDGDGGFYSAFPLREVDSYFLVKEPT